jgi:hypothetical protein
MKTSRTLYGVETKRLIQQVKRNLKRFPDDFMFQLTRAEAEALRSQIATQTTVVVAVATRHMSSRSKAWQCSPEFCAAIERSP